MSTLHVTTTVIHIVDTSRGTVIHTILIILIVDMSRENARRIDYARRTDTTPLCPKNRHDTTTPKEPTRHNYARRTNTTLEIGSTKRKNIFDDQHFFFH
jgi:hypothetical protein